MPQHPDDQLIEPRRRQTRTCKHLAIAAGLALTVGSSIINPPPPKRSPLNRINRQPPHHGLQHQR